VLERDGEEKARLALARALDALQDLLLRLGAEAAQRGQPIGLGRGLELVQAADAELLVQHANLGQAEVGNAEELEDAGGELRAQLVEVARAPFARQLLDDRGGRLANAGRLDQRAGGDQLAGVAVLRAQRARGALESERLETIRFRQFEVARDLIERSGDFELVHSHPLLSSMLMQARDRLVNRLIVALDRSSRDDILRLADQLHGAGVTILTSIDDAELHRIGFAGTALENAVRLARLAQSCGLGAVVASPQEIAAIREACGGELRIIAPGIRPAGSDAGDQRRTMTPAAAIAAGADTIVVGRPITDARDPRAAALEVIESLV